MAWKVKAQKLKGMWLEQIDNLSLWHERRIERGKVEGFENIFIEMEQNQVKKKRVGGREMTWKFNQKCPPW